MRIALIFDVDGVIFDSHPFHRRVWRTLLRETGKSVSDAELDYTLEGSTRDEFFRHFWGRLSPQQIGAYASRKDALFRELEDQVETVKGLEEFLGLVESAAIRMAIASSGSRPRILRMLDRHGLTNRFATILTGDDVSAGKNDPLIFLRAAEGLKVSPAEAVVFEDSITAAGVATKVGLKCVGIANGLRRAKMLKAGASLVLPDFTNLRLRDIYRLFGTAPAARQESASLPA